MIYILSTIRFILRVLLLSAVVSVYLSLSQNNNKRTFVVETFYNYEFLVYDNLLYVVITPSYKINGISRKKISRLILVVLNMMCHPKLLKQMVKLIIH
jgi:hypothetical protein